MEGRSVLYVPHDEQFAAWDFIIHQNTSENRSISFFSLSISLPSKHDRSTATKGKQPIGKIEKSFKHEYIPNINFKDKEMQQRSQVEQILDAFTGQKGHRAEFKNNRFTVKDSTNKQLDNVHFYFGCARPQAEVANDNLKYHNLRMIARESFEKLGVLFEAKPPALSHDVTA